MKKIILLLLIVLLFSLNGFSATINDSQIIPPDSNIYSDFAELQRSNKLLVFTNNTPISVGELKFYLKQFDYDQMDAYSRMVYDRLYSSLHETEDITTFPGFELSVHPQVNLEGYIKTNKDIPWSFNYYYKDNFISIPLDMGFGNNFAMG
ncbi:MAG: hypothetical protein J5747_03230, partial [Spirochaetaceae bacterium]|nr:hypothetical protein [Spirochaetaceae bacterium]